MEDLKNQEIVTSNSSVGNIFSYKCNDCNCNFLTTGENQTNCIYCESSNITSNDYELDNTKIVSFSKEQEEAIKKYKRIIRFNPLIPIKFKSKKTIELIKKVYYLTYLVSANVSGNVNFLTYDSDKEDKKNRMSFDINLDYANCLININKEITKQEFEDAFNIDFQVLQDFKLEDLKEPVILSNYTNDEIMNNINKKLNKNSLNTVANNINNKKRKLESNETDIKISSVQYVLVPIYFLNMKYRDKNYHYLFNGSNGNTSYKFPIGIVETIIFSIIVFGLVFLIGYLIALAI